MERPVKGPPPNNTQHSPETDIQAPGGIRTKILKKEYIYIYIYIVTIINACNYRYLELLGYHLSSSIQKCPEVLLASFTRETA
jgi:hypothetical protein